MSISNRFMWQHHYPKWISNPIVFTDLPKRGDSQPGWWSMRFGGLPLLSSATKFISNIHINICSYSCLSIRHPWIHESSIYPLVSYSYYQIHTIRYRKYGAIFFNGITSILVIFIPSWIASSLALHPTVSDMFDMWVSKNRGTPTSSSISRWDFPWHKPSSDKGVPPLIIIKITTIHHH